MRVLPLLGLAAAAAAAAGPAAQAAPPRLGPIVRVETPGTTPCPAESEPATLATEAGTWVAYNDLHNCVPAHYAGELKRITSVQLLPASGGAPRYLGIEPAGPGEILAGDPSLAPAPGGGVYLATMYQGGDTRLRVYRISPSFAVTALPDPAVHPAGENLDDKEVVASDTGPRSRYRGRVYLAWDDLRAFAGMFRAFTGTRWTDPVAVGPTTTRPDVAVAPNGDVAVAYEVDHGVAVRVSTDGGRTFGPQRVVVTGGLPGHTEPSCLTIFTAIGPRQRVTRAVSATYDARGRLHVVAAFGTAVALPTPTDFGMATGDGTSRLVWATSGDGVRWQVRGVPGGEALRFHPAITTTPAGGVAVAWLQVADANALTYDAYLAVAAPGAAAFGAPVRLSAAAAAFPSVLEAQGTSTCYGIGDYIGIARTARGVVVAWPSTDETTLPHVDSDVLVREAVLS